MVDQYLVFTGRPNAGKSSVIKVLTGIDTRIGKHPGTTKRPEMYRISDNLILVDMPGYGRSLRSSREEEEANKDAILDFLNGNADSIILAVHVVNAPTFLEMEARLFKKGFIPLDVEMVHFMKRDHGISTIVVANKIDKAPKFEIDENIEALREALGPSISVYPLSSRTEEGVGPLKHEVRRRLQIKGFQNPFELLKS